MAIQIRSAKNKAVKAQNAVRDCFREVFHWIDPQAFKCALMGERGADVAISAEARAAGADYSVEVKAYARFAVEGFMDQARAKKGRPLVFLKGDRKKMLVLMEAEDFFELAAERAEAHRKLPPSE